MIFTMHFRGAAVLAAKGSVISEVLFPNTERVPPDGQTRKIKEKDNVIAVVMEHADETPAPRHESGALIVGRNGPNWYRRLMGCVVQLSGASSGAAFVNHSHGELPELSKVITTSDYRLKLLDSEERKESDPQSNRIATRFRLDGGKISPAFPAEDSWTIRGEDFGDTLAIKKLMTGASWTVEVPGNEAELALEVRPLSDADSIRPAEEYITLNADQSEVYFYNYDIGLPTVDDLKRPLEQHADYLTDHDFKWAYRLLDRVDPRMTSWQVWLHGKLFPAPERHQLIPTSTCIQTIWHDE